MKLHAIIFLMKIIHSKNGEAVTFMIDDEGLKNMSNAYP